MAKEKTLKCIFINLFYGFLIYFVIINIVLLNQYGMLFTPYESLLISMFNLFEEPKTVAWAILIICEMVVWLE